MANRLADLLQNNRESLTKFAKVKSKEDALATAKSYISGYTEAELLKDIQELQEASATEGKLNENQLESVVGGAFNWGGFFTAVVPAIVGGAGVAWNAYQQNKG